MKLRLVGAVVLAASVIALVVFGVSTCHRKQLVKEAPKLVTQYAVDTTLYKGDTTVTDTALNNLPDSLPGVRPVKAAVKSERASAGRAIKTAEKRITNLQKQLRPATVKLFAEADYSIPDAHPLLEGTLAARVGVMVRVRDGTYATGYVEQPISGTGRRTYHVGIRQEFRLF